METFKKWVNSPYVIATLLVFFASIDLVLLGSWFELGKSDWAAWVQAVGVFVGFGIAIHVPYRQREDAIKAEKKRLEDEAYRVRLAIKDELRALEKNFSGPNVTHLLSRPPGDIFDLRIPIPAQRFPVYAALIDRLTLISDDELRAEISGAYELATGLIICAQENNRLLEDYNLIQTEMEYRPDAFQARRRDFNLVQMVAMCKQMKLICEKSMELVRAVIPKL